MSAATLTRQEAMEPQKPLAAMTRPLLVVLPFLVLLLAASLLPDWAVQVPKGWTIPFVDWANMVFDHLRDDAIFGLFSFRDLTRGAAELITWPLAFVEGLLVSGFPDIGIAAMPWVMTAGLSGVLGWYLRDWRLGALAAGCVAYMAIFGKWELSMITLSVVLVAAPIAGLIGFGIGILAVKKQWFEALVVPLLNVLQSLPHFSYLIPIAIFIGVGHKAGAIATVIFAIPPMARLTILGLKGVAEEVREAGKMAGCTRFQTLWMVEIPSARQPLLVGVNQVIMQCLAMVVIASFVGARGLGHDLLFRLQALKIGQALESGVAIVLMAITLDQLSRAAAHKEPSHLAPDASLLQRFPFLAASLAVIAASLLLAAITPYAQAWPSELALSTAPFWDALVDWITVTLYDPLQYLRNAMLLYVLIPIRDLFQSIPWTAMVALVAAAGWSLGGFRLAAIVSGFVLFIAFAGYWERSLITAYMVTVAVLLCIMIGLPIGIWASRSERRTGIAKLLCDTFQTFPSFIYLIPVIMLFKVGDVAAISAIIIYAMIPIVRYTIFGLRNVPQEIVEAGITSGCTQRQLLWNIRMPLAFPEIMLGINQTIMFALFMVIIAAFIGTKDIGQEIFRALTFNDAGKGLVLGLCVAFMGLTADQLITAWATRRKQKLGLAG
ncbi:ABC transporter permease [Aminobacter ciceronei]|jgi:glycine betaine/proline transport system permease protein|uniref:Glycine betaine/proline transport system permease protein n=1 Tax=Aminobacter ciceronei TaxID=150723 RepID=A0ABR6CIS0_9HYPH|nr:ABC transporter permease subunit [Aminobacter ciceronei]MBA8910745.1 glycine betaine/proline transport system permease protein [Aminobacter ciceronei]MBA9024523.1 glycine betaine/proline transport system permease protein [Aminobacter ciceronei]